MICHDLSITSSLMGRRKSEKGEEKEIIRRRRQNSHDRQVCVCISDDAVSRKISSDIYSQERVFCLFRVALDLDSSEKFIQDVRFEKNEWDWMEFVYLWSNVESHILKRMRRKWGEPADLLGHFSLLFWINARVLVSSTVFLFFADSDLFDTHGQLLAYARRSFGSSLCSY